MKRIARICKGNKAGFSMLTVLVAISFVGIMAMLVIAISGVNFKMRMTEMKGKESFYITERALEEIKAGLQEDVGEALASAYVQVLEQYNEIDSSSGEGLDMQRQRQFKFYFIDELSNRLQGDRENTYNMDKIKGYVDLLDSMQASSNGKEQLSVLNTSNQEPYMKVVAGESILLQYLKIIHIDANGYASILETDIRLKVPEVTFPTPSTLPDLMNMIVVANNGISCVGGLAGTNTQIHIKGNLYAGSHINIGSHTNVVFSEGERVVSIGQVTVSQGGSLTTEEETALWAEGIDLSSATLNLKGNTYVADDLTISRGNDLGSFVTLSGEYYGYGSKESAEGSYFKQVGLKYENESLSQRNSSIIINGKNTTLNLSGLQRFMLAGNSYIGNPSIGTGGEEGALTGESLTIKGTQIAYLIPSSIIGDGEGTNPMTYKEYEAALVNGELTLDWNSPVDEWDGRSLKDIGLNKNTPYTTIMYPTGNGEGFVYVYLNFETSENASKFFEWYYKENESRKKQIDQYISFYLSDEGIVMNKTDSFLRFITNGNVLQYSNGQGNVIGSEDNSVTQDVIYEQINYQNTWYSLTRKMIPNFDMLSEEEKSKDRQVFENLIQEEVFEEMTDNLQGRMEFFSTNIEEEEIKALVLDQSSEFVITDEVAEDLRLLICNGDVTIKSGVYFQGIIMTKGSITIEDGATLTSNASEAARLLQAESNGKTLAMLFYNGDQYVIGNSGSNSSFEGNSNSYDLENYITYENWSKR